MIKNITVKYCLLLVFTIGGMSHSLPVNGQNIISADPTNSFDMESIFVNPAVIPFQHRQVTLGMKIYQLGFISSEKLGLRTSYFSFALPEAFSGLINLGVTGQNFSVPMYDQTNFSVLLAKRPIERLSVGIRYNLFSKSYHEKFFNLVTPDDPVFANGTLKFAHSIGVGLIAFPWSTLSVAFSCDHLNRPDVSLFNDTYKQPLVYDFGFRYSLGYFSSSLFFNYFQNQWQLNWIFESRPSSFSTIKLGFVERSAKFGAQIHLFDGLSINYSYDYPFYEISQLSSGSHQISFLYDLDHADPIRELQFSKYDDAKFPIFNLPSQFFVDMDSDRLKIITRKIVRTIDEEVPQNALANLTELELAFNDSEIGKRQLYRHGKLGDKNLNSLFSSAKYSKKYEQWIADNFSSAGIDSLRFITNLNSAFRAENLRDSLIVGASFRDRQIEIKQLQNDPVTKRIDPHRIAPMSEADNYFLEPESVAFHISSLKIRNYNGVWKLVILDCTDHGIKTFAAKGRVPEAVSWDWRDSDGILIKPDIYYFYFQWQDKNKQWRRTQPKMFTVTKISRTLNIHVRSRPDDKDGPGRIVEIKLAN